MRVGYVLKRYPRYSETFVVNEILAHESARAEIEIFALRGPEDSHFQPDIGRVRAPVTYLSTGGGRAASFWSSLRETGTVLGGFWDKLGIASGEDARELTQALELARLAREGGIELLHAHFANEAATVARLAGEFSGLPYTLTAHAKDIFHEDVTPEALARKLGDAAAVVTVSEFNRMYLRDMVPGLDGKLERIYNGLPLERFPYADPGERPALIVGAGRLVEKKGFVDLVEACAILARRGREFRCVIVGGGPVEPELREAIDRLEVASIVELVGSRSVAEVGQLVQSAAALAAPCVVAEDGNRDGLPTVLLEAMALGTPCVSTPVTGIPEVLQDGETGLLVPEHAPEALADALEKLLSEPLLRVRLAENARALVEREFDIGRNAAKLRAVFEGCVRSYPNPLSRAS